MLLFILALVGGILDRIAVAVMAGAVSLGADVIIASNLLGNYGGAGVGLTPETLAMEVSRIGLIVAAGFLLGLFLRGAFLFVLRRLR
ncbi:MAG: hypothetical protein AAFW98_10225 [Pseudomonadota bacterium]